MAPAYKAPVAAPLFNWTGPYWGVHLGYGWGSGDDDVTFLPDPTSFGADPFVAPMDLKGWLGGIQAGYNWQSGIWVGGVEADIAYSGIDGDAFVTPLWSDDAVVPDSFHRGSQDIKWFGTVRARLGVTPSDRMLVYATGGLAFGRVNFESFTSYQPLNLQTQYGASDSKWKAGWTLGGGFEWAFAADSSWSFKAEYLYFDLGDTKITAFPLAPNPPYAVVNNWETKGHIVRVGLNKRFATW
jgi:outer membrane immunogenic protein